MFRPHVPEGGDPHSYGLENFRTDVCSTFGLFYCEVGVVARLLAGRPMSWATIPGSDEGFVPASKLPYLP